MPDPYPWSGPIPSSGGGGGLFGGLLGGGNSGAVPGLLSGGTDQLMEQLIRRQLEQSMRPDFGRMAQAFAAAAMPSRYPVPMGAVLGQVAGAMSGGDEAATKALASLKMLQELQLARRKAGWIDKFLADEGTGGTGQTIRDALAPSLPGVTPLSTTSRPPAPRLPLSDVTSGDLSGSRGEVPAEEPAGGDADLTAAAPSPAPRAALPVTRAAYAPGSAAKSRFLDLAEQFESGGRNVPNYKYGPGYTASGVLQITDPTWRDFAPAEVQAVYPRAIDAPIEVQRAVAQRIPVNRWTDSNPRLAAALPAAGLPPPRIPDDSWMNRPAANSGFRDPGFAPGNQAAAERLRQSILGMAAGGSPLVEPSQSPTAAIAGLPPQDEVLPSGRPTLPGLLKAQYSTVPGVDPSQSPAVALGGGSPTPPMAAPPGARPPMAPQSQPGVTVPTVPTPANMDPTKIQNLMVDLARKSAMAEALGLPNVYGPMISVLQNSPQYKAMVEHATKGAALPFEYAGPQYNPQVQGNVEAAKQAAIQLGKYLGPEYDSVTQKMLKDIEEKAKAEQRSVKLRIGNQEYDVTAAERADYNAGKGIPSLGIPPDPSKARPGTVAPTPSVAPPPGGTRVYTPEEEAETKARGAALAKREQEYRDAADLSRETKSTLTSVAADLNNVVKGPWANTAQTFMTYARLLDPSFNTQVSSYEGAQSAVNALVRKAVRESDPNPTFLQTKMAIESMPSPLQSEGGSQKIAGRMVGFANHNIARASAMQQWLDQKGTLNGFDADWRGKVSPFAFVYLQMDAADRQLLTQHLAQTKQGERERERLQAQVRYIQQNAMEQ